ncbi:MAG: L,D-transpeptidase family protein [Phycisphaerales bacterium]|nr:L,D-transpeptidase family protein [Phycisphaerales bacterium]
MALPSQMEQSGSSGRGHVYARQNKGGKPLMIALGILVVAGAAAGVWALKGTRAAGPASSQAGEKSVAPATGGATPGVKAPAKQPTVPPVSLAPKGPAVKEPEKPVTLQQGTASADKPETAGPLTKAVERSGAPASTPGAGGPGPDPRTQADNPKPAPVDLSRPDGKPVTPGPGEASPSVVGNPLAASGSTMEVRSTIEAGDKKLAGGDLVQARVLYSRALADRNAAREDQERLRGKLAQINQDLLFSPKIVAGDPLVETYTVVGGDSLVKIARKRDLVVDWRLIQRVNAMSSPNVLREGQKLKLVRGPFHAVVHKGDYRLDVYTGAPDDPANWVYIRSFRVGLGANDKTPVGEFTVKPKSKLVNPPWTNPQTGERFGADDPKNPIGEHWIGIEGLGDSKQYTGFGLHGTIEPDSIGQQKSMGCVRLGTDDIALLYELLKEGVSIVKIEA